MLYKYAKSHFWVLGRHRFKLAYPSLSVCTLDGVPEPELRNRLNCTSFI